MTPLPHTPQRRAECERCRRNEASDRSRHTIEMLPEEARRLSASPTISALPILITNTTSTILRICHTIIRTSRKISRPTRAYIPRQWRTPLSPARWRPCMLKTTGSSLRRIRHNIKRVVDAYKVRNLQSRRSRTYIQR